MQLRYSESDQDEDRYLQQQTSLPRNYRARTSTPPNREHRIFSNRSVCGLREAKACLQSACSC